VDVGGCRDSRAFGLVMSVARQDSNDLFYLSALLL